LVDSEGVPLASTTRDTLDLSVDEHGLFLEAYLDPTRPDVAVIRSAHRAGGLDMTFAFRVNRQSWNHAYSERQLQEVNLHHGVVSVSVRDEQARDKGRGLFRSRRAS
jgi:phage head maturation protease